MPQKKTGENEQVHSTTAADLARIMRYCIKESPQKEAFLNITRTQSYTFWDIEKKRSFSCNNHNAFLSMMEGALSGKTGFTAKAGYCYVGALKREEKTLIVALLACGWPNNKTYKWKDTVKLMEYGLNQYEQKSLLEQGTFFAARNTCGRKWTGRGNWRSSKCSHKSEDYTRQNSFNAKRRIGSSHL